MNKQQRIKEAISLLEKVTGKKVILEEGVWGNLMKGVRAGGSGPWSIVVIENKKVIDQVIDIKYKEMLPANYEGIKRKHPKAKIHIEDAGGSIVWSI